jgi:hypothetical protein
MGSGQDPRVPLFQKDFIFGNNALPPNLPPVLVLIPFKKSLRSKYQPRPQLQMRFEASFRDP